MVLNLAFPYSNMCSLWFAWQELGSEVSVQDIETSSCSHDLRCPLCFKKGCSQPVVMSHLQMTCKCSCDAEPRLNVFDLIFLMCSFRNEFVALLVLVTMLCSSDGFVQLGYFTILQRLESVLMLPHVSPCFAILIILQRCLAEAHSFFCGPSLGKLQG